MTQKEKWEHRYNEVVSFIETNKRNPSRYDDTERGLYWNWLHHNRKQLNAGKATVHKESDRMRIRSS